MSYVCAIYLHKILDFFLFRNRSKGISRCKIYSAAENYSRWNFSSFFVCYSKPQIFKFSDFVKWTVFSPAVKVSSVPWNYYGRIFSLFIFNPFSSLYQVQMWLFFQFRLFRCLRQFDKRNFPFKWVDEFWKHKAEFVMARGCLSLVTRVVCAVNVVCRRIKFLFLYIVLRFAKFSPE